MDDVGRQAMEDDIRRLSDELDVLALDLKAWFQAVLTLRERNVPPSGEIAKRAHALHEFFDTLRSRIADLAFATEPDLATPVFDLHNPAALKECLLEIAAARKRQAEQRRSACDVLDQLLRIAHLEYPNWAPLDSIQSEALALQKAFEQQATPELRSAVGAVVDRRHQLALLIRFVSDAKLEDKEWDTLGRRIRDLFGDDVAISAARGKLSVVPPGAQAEPVLAEPTPDSSEYPQPPEPARDENIRPPTSSPAPAPHAEPAPPPP